MVLVENILINLLHKQNITDNNQKQTKSVTFLIEYLWVIRKEILCRRNLDHSYKTWKRGYELYHVSSSQIYHKVRASSGEEVSEFSAYWYYRNSPSFRLNKLIGIYKISSLLYHFLRLPYLILKWSFKKPKIIKSLLKGIKDAIYRT